MATMTNRRWDITSIGCESETGRRFKCHGTGSTQHVQSRVRVTPAKTDISIPTSRVPLRCALLHTAAFPADVVRRGAVGGVRKQSFGWGTSLNLVSGGTVLSKLRKTGTWRRRCVPCNGQPAFKPELSRSESI